MHLFFLSLSFTVLFKSDAMHTFIVKGNVFHSRFFFLSLFPSSSSSLVARLSYNNNNKNSPSSLFSIDDNNNNFDRLFASSLFIESIFS